MGGVLLSLCFLLLKWFVIIIKAEETNITFPIILNETDIKNFNKKSILRYGFHRTHKCLDFLKTYVCINTCLTRGFDIASASKDCTCTCFKDKIKSKYIDVKLAWKLPTTTIPAWAGSYLHQSAGEFVLVHKPGNKIEYLKHHINETALYGNNSSEEHHNETHSDGETEDEDADHLKHHINESLFENNETALYGNNSSEEHLTKTHSDDETEGGESGSVESEGSDTDSGEAEGGDTGSGDAEGGDTDSGVAESGEAEGGDNDSGVAESEEPEGGEPAGGDTDSGAAGSLD